MKLMKLFSVMLAFCMLPVTLTQAQSLKQLLKAAKEAKKELKNRQEEVLETNHAEPVAITNANDEIALVVSAEGVTKEETVKIALRSAIEQSYGTFVSANTTLLADEIVKDEIVTVTTGNIKEYQELADVALPNGNRSVTLKAVVCISKLVSYAQSKGAETEFAGATFAMNMKMKELNKKNELVALYNLLEQLKKLAPTAFNKKLTIKDPRVTSTEEVCRLLDLDGNKTYSVQKGKYVWPAGFDEKYNWIYDQFLLNFYELFSIYYDKTSDSIIYEPQRGEALRKWTESADNSYLMDMEVKILPNENTNAFWELIFNTLKSLSLSDTERGEYDSQNIPYCWFEFLNYFDEEHRGETFYFRTPGKEMKKWKNELACLLCFIYSNFKIVDNTGTESFFNGYDYLTHGKTNELCVGDKGDVCGKQGIMSGYGLFKFAKVNECERYFRTMREQISGDSYNSYIDFYIYPFKWSSIKFLIPKDEIMKYSNFRIENRW